MHFRKEQCCCVCGSSGWNQQREACLIKRQFFIATSIMSHSASGWGIRQSFILIKFANPNFPSNFFLVKFSAAAISELTRIQLDLSSALLWTSKHPLSVCVHQMHWNYNSNNSQMARNNGSYNPNKPENCKFSQGKSISRISDRGHAFFFSRHARPMSVTHMKLPWKPIEVGICYFYPRVVSVFP